MYLGKIDMPHWTVVQIFKNAEGCPNPAAVEIKGIFTIDLSGSRVKPMLRTSENPTT